MKKIYTAPAAVAMTLNAESPVLNASLDINEGEADQWSRKKRYGWNCEN